MHASTSLILVTLFLVKRTYLIILFVRCRPPSVHIQDSHHTVGHKSQEGHDGIHYVVPEDAIGICTAGTNRIVVEKECSSSSTNSKVEVEESYQQPLHTLWGLGINEFHSYVERKVGAIVIQYTLQLAVV